MMKLVSGFLTFALTLGFLILSFAAPANASIPTPDKITYCQAQGNGIYHEITAATRSLVDKDGIKQGGINQNDIVAPFAWDFGGDFHGSLPEGFNYTGENINFLANHCVPSPVKLTPPGWTVTDYTCTLPGSAVLTNPDSRLTITGPTVTGKTVTASFALPKNTQYITYTWDDDTTADKTLTHTMADPITDALWDSALGACRTPDTGAGISTNVLLMSGGAFLAGAILLSILGFTNRRKA
jgi:hypothetical protein